MNSDSFQSAVGCDGHFRTTQWTLVLRAGQTGNAESRKALESLCGRYWRPLYVFARHKGLSVELAEDLIQGFFEQFLRRNVLGDVEKGRGQFRSFLRKALEFYMTKDWEKSQALKRGSSLKILSLDFEKGEEWYQLEAAADQTPEKAYERQWVVTILDRAMSRLREESAKQGRRKFLERVEDMLVGDRGNDSYIKAAQELEMSPGAVRVSVFRYRRRLRAILREEVRETVERPEDVDDEIQKLLTLY